MNQVELVILRRVARAREPLVQNQIVPLGIAGQLAPDDKGLPPVRHHAVHGTEPPRPVIILFEPAINPEPPLIITFEYRTERLWGSNVVHRQTNQIIENLQQIDINIAIFIATWLFNYQLIRPRTSKEVQDNCTLLKPSGEYCVSNRSPACRRPSSRSCRRRTRG